LSNSGLNERQWAMLCHLSGLSGYLIPLGNIIAPLIIWSMKKEESVEVDKHGKESLNFQLSLVIYFFVAALLIVLVVGVFLLISLAILQVVCIIIASIKADKGEFYEYPLTIRFIK